MVTPTNEEEDNLPKLREHLESNPMPVTKAIEFAEEHYGIRSNVARQFIDFWVRNGDLEEETVHHGGVGRPWRMVGGNPAPEGPA